MRTFCSLLGKILRNSQNIRAYYMLNHTIRCTYSSDRSFGILVVLGSILLRKYISSFVTCLCQIDVFKLTIAFLGQALPPLYLNSICFLCSWTFPQVLCRAKSLSLSCTLPVTGTPVTPVTPATTFVSLQKRKTPFKKHFLAVKLSFAYKSFTIVIGFRQ